MSCKLSSYILKTFTEDGEMILKNSLTQSMLKVSKDKINSVESIFDNVPETYDVMDSMAKKLYKHGFIIEDYVNEQQIVDYIFNDAVYGNNILELTIIPTNACNFDCVYCYQKEPYYYMSDDTVDKLLLFLRKHIREYSGLLISWFGGEPLLAKELMIRLMKNVRNICIENKVPFYSNVTTNGYELDLVTFRELTKNHLRYYQITIDGPAIIHNSQRPHKVKKDSFEKIVSNLLEIKDNCSKINYKIALRVNVSSALQPYLEEFVNWLYNTFGDDKHFVVVWEFVRDWGGDKIDKNRDLIQSHEGANKWLDILSKRGFAINMGYEQNNLTVALCIASKKNGYVLNHDGKLYKCSMVVEEEDFKQVNCIGEITTDGNLEIDCGKMVKWIGRAQVQEKCFPCPHYPECMGISCPLGSLILNQENRCSELFIDDYEYLLRNRDVVGKIEKI